MTARCAYNPKVINIFKEMKTRSYNPQSREWSFHVSEHDELVSRLGKCSNVSVKALPATFLKALRELESQSSAVSSEMVTLEQIWQALPPDLLAGLLPFQREGIAFAIRHGGRALIGDEMGLGKTVQAIAIAKYYEKEWPLLIVTPSPLRLVWKQVTCSPWLVLGPSRALQELMKWLKDVDHDDVNVVMSGEERVVFDSY